MVKKNKIIVLFIITVCGLSAVTYSLYELSSINAIYGDHDILFLCIDPSETESGMGAVDRAYVISMSEGNITNFTTISPSKMTHPNITVSEYLNSQSKKKLSLHDCFLGNDTEKDAQVAQEIVEYKKGIKTDVVLAATPTGIDTIINTIGPIAVQGVGPITGGAIDWVQEDQSNGTSRDLAVQSLMSAISNSTEDKTTFSTMMKIASDQYHDGNIYVYPKLLFNRFLIAEDLTNIFSII